MAFIPTPNTIRVSFQFTWASQIVEITIAVTKASPWGEADMLTTLNDLSTWAQDELLPNLSNQLSLYNLTATSQESSSAPVVELPVSPPVSGSLDNPTVPNNVTLATSFLTPLRGRSYRGRVYTPGIDRTQLVSSTQYNSGIVAALTAAYAAINAAFTVVDAEHAVISTRTNNAARTTGVATSVTGYRTESFVDSQRRRLAGRGQ